MGSYRFGGCLGLCSFLEVLVVIWLFIEYWWIVVPTAIIIGIAIIMGWNED